MSILNLIKSFFRKESVGLDISERSLEYTVLRKNKDVAIQYRAREVVPPGVIENGAIQDSRKLALVLKKFLWSYPLFNPRLPVVMALPESQVFIHHLSFKKSDLKSSLREEILHAVQKSVPLDISEFDWDYNVTQETKDSYDIVFAAIPQKVISGFRDVALDLGLHSVIFEPESLALLRSIVSAADYEGGALVIVDFGTLRSALYLADKDGLQYSVSIRHGGEETTKTIAEKFQISFREAEARKIKFGFTDSNLALILQRIPQVIIREIVKLIGFYEGQGRKVAKILLTGGESLLPGFQDYFSQNVDKSVVLVSLDDDILYSVAIGLALRGFEKSKGMNFFPKGKS